MKEYFKDKVAVVTGGGGGIGRAVCIKLADLGTRVVVVDLSTEIGSQTAELIKQAGGEARFVKADVTKADEVERYVKQTIAAYGRIDIFVNNAAWEGAVQPIVDLSVETFDQVIAINLRGAFLGLKYVLPVMLEQQSGAVINMSSVGGFVGSRGYAAYDSSKHALIGLNKVAALEVANHGIRVNAVCPGAVNTRMMRSLEEQNAPGAGEQYKKSKMAVIPDGRYAEPEEVANLVIYFASDLSSHITGQSLMINGGQIMR